MAQNGFHGLVGLAVARGMARRVPEGSADAFTGGVVLGAMLPDVDMYPTAVVFLAGHQELIYSVHRTLTHSLWIPIALALAGWTLARRRAGPAWLLQGLALGMATHLFLDVFFWFVQLDLFWPLSHVPAGRPLLPIPNLWEGFHPPVLLSNVMQAVELAAFALLLLALRRVVQRADGPDAKTGRLLRWERWMWAAFVVALAAAPLLSKSLQEVLVTTPYLLAFLPFCWTQTWRLRGAVARWARAGAEVAP